MKFPTVRNAHPREPVLAMGVLLRRAARLLRGALGASVLLALACQTGTGTSKLLPCAEATIAAVTGTPPPVVKAISSPTDCKDNPCNPYCRSYSESPDGGVVSTMGEGNEATWTQAAVADLPDALVEEAIGDRCMTGADCQLSTQCAGPVTESCEHDKCAPGDALDPGCDPCIDDVCALIPECCTDRWDEVCIAAMEQSCDVSCKQIGTGECVPWVPGERDERCRGVDLTVAPVCDGVLPICNHGTETAPGGVRILHFPSDAEQFASPEPDEDYPGAEECFTDQPIPPGTCIEVTSCEGLRDAREILVNPVDPSGAATSYHVSECSIVDNWGLSIEGVECKPAACEVETVSTPYRGSCRFEMPGKGGRSPTRTKLRLEHAATSEVVALTLVPDVHACSARGWYFEDTEEGTALSLCPATCTELQEPDTALTAELACPGGGFELASRAETYAPECGADYAIQWGFLTYDFSTPEDSAVEVRVRYADTPEDLAGAPWQLVATASEVLGTEKCTPLSAAPCPIDLFELLGGAPAAHSRYVEVMNTAFPSSGGFKTPTLTSWDLSFSCIPDF